MTALAGSSRDVEFEAPSIVVCSGDTVMQGFITERNLAQAEQEFPGIARFFDLLLVKPRTFLELVAAFDHWCDRARDGRAAGRC